MTACVRDGCDGTYLPDGSCDECGFFAPTASEATPPAAPPASARTEPMPSGRSTGNRTRAARTVVDRVTLPPIAVPNPAAAVLTDPKVPYHRRKCPNCGEPVGQPRGDRPGLDSGFCPRDRTPFSYVPALARHAYVERYEVFGCLTYGGLGWIYLARDSHLGDDRTERWVVLKGLINSHDPDAVAAATRERQYLVTVDHPNVVQISDFVEHTDPRTGVVAGYIVMEYLPGRTLHQVLVDPAEPEPLPVPVVLRYADDLLDALGYLHRRDLVYCDLKQHNVMQVEQRVKLIDLGAVMRADSDTASYGTVGFMAPEVETGEHQPTPHSDLYTLGRTMAALTFPFLGFSDAYRHRLPADIPYLAGEESFVRLLRRAANPNPRARFTAAEDMRDQVVGVLAETLSRADAEPYGVNSALFTRERRVFGTGAGVVRAVAAEAVEWREVPACLPSPLVDPADPAAGFLATLAGVAPDRLVETLLGAGERTPELLLRLAEAHVLAGEPGAARAVLAEFAEALPDDWRTDWYLGLAAIADDPAAAADRFDAVYSALPGEPAAKLALAAAVERTGDPARARALYARVWDTDRTYVSAAFGLARAHAAQDDHRAAVAVLDQVPDSSNHHTAAQVAAIRALVRADLLPDAATRLDALTLDAERTARLNIEVHGAALAARADHPTDHRGAAEEEAETALRRRLEQAYRALAKLTPDRDTRSALVDRANEVRPWTLV
ncbi:tetratricopeptide repeat protein [Actinokineospora auranticolor]|uniref:non-specific serine/threonine protein kinase n=1 Tax=Actinokineospora auranticolor TaxID=155976 RepID=A0A2S6GMB9_9PSEU|nr:serine/threonine-protein kinase [Actinokineospora auranticolor]PPK66389.1 serine/threonine-protein kinase PknG [Actinokineospora auranticolor]